jgi:hypothetical protein
MTVIKSLTPPQYIQPIKSVMNIGRQEHYKLTLPGLVRGQAILPTKKFEEYMITQQELSEQFFSAVDQFVGIYPRIKDQAQTKLGSAYKERDFPSVHAIKSFFDYRVIPAPIPDATDWRLDGVANEDVSNLQATVEEGVRQMYADATATMFERAREKLENFYRQAKNYNVKAPGAMLRDPTVDQMREFAELICDMNITNDPKLEKLGKEMLKDFCDLKGTELRKSAEMRTDIASKAKKLLDKLSPVKQVAA